MSSQVKALEPLKSSGFTFGANGFVVNGIKREDNASLRRLLFTDEIKGKIAQRYARQNADKTINKKWTAAQLKHYGIKFKSSEKAEDLQVLLRDQVRQGMCTTVPPTVKAIEDSLGNDWKRKNKEHVDAQQNSRKQEYKKLNTPTEKASYDLDLFLQEYFLADRSLTTTPVRLPGFENRASLHQAAEKIPGLYTVSSGSDRFRTLVIGWGENEVRKECSKMSAGLHEQESEELQSRWATKLERHQAFKRKKSTTASSKQPFDLESIRGTYIVKCKEIEEQWPSSSDDLRLRIMNSQRAGWTGIFDFGVLEGVMLFGTDRQRLNQKRSDIERGESCDSELEEEIGSESDEDDAELDEDECEDDDRYDDDKYEAEISPTPSSSRKRDAPTGGASRPSSSKRSKQSAAQPHRVFLQWRGCETGEGEIQLDDDNQNTGHLDFTDASCTEFHGVASFVFVGDQVEFQGYKIESLGGPATRSWMDYSEADYEFARVPSSSS